MVHSEVEKADCVVGQNDTVKRVPSGRGQFNQGADYANESGTFS
jgi:hypothetical protein